VELLEVTVPERLGDAVEADKELRFRLLKDLVEAVPTLASASQILPDNTAPDAGLRKQLFARISPNAHPSPVVCKSEPHRIPWRGCTV
jgi:hypothetical protein